MYACMHVCTCMYVCMYVCDIHKITFGPQGETGIIHSFSEFRMAPCDLDLFLGGGPSEFLDECNPSKIFKMASNSFEVTDVTF